MKGRPTSSASSLHGPGGDVDAKVGDAIRYQPTSETVFSMPVEPTPYSNAALLYGAYGGLVDTTPTTYSNASTLYGPSMGVPAAPTQLAGQAFSAQFPDALPGALVAGPGAGEIPLDAAIRGYRGGYAGVLDPSPTAAYAGKLVGDAAQSFKDFGYQLAGAASADAARAAWNNGNYGLAVAKEAQAFGEAGLALTGIGEIAQPATMAARKFAGAFAEVADTLTGNYVDKTGLRLAMADSNGTAGASSRLRYMGGTPDKYSRTGLEVVERMRNDGLVIGDGPLLRGNPNNLQLVGPGGALTRIDATVDMAHRIDAVTWWNDVGRFYGPKSPEVRQFMLNSDNYVLQPRSINRSAGASLGQTYQPPVSPDFTNLKR
ncbi:hypothetical protein [Burkholderia gladioli]|uniref:hypothetical protein n=1 Tax=Burkholderia gladioli TaxID=28095 RepID=UPI001ABA8FCF|nr:hypothetical protein [Burkholderia gladioli]